MTTKNLEFVFNLQAFALSDNATIGATGGNITVGTGYDEDGASEVYIVSSSYDSDTEMTTYVTDTSWTDTYTYYAFSSTDTSAVLSVNVTTSSDTTTGDSSVISGMPVADSLVGSPVTIQGGTSASTNIALNNVGTISGELSANSNVGLTANGTALRLTNVSGDAITLNTATANFQQTLNGATVRAALSGSEVVLNGGSDGSALTISAAGVSALSSIDTKQTWDLASGDSVVYNRLSVTGDVDVTGVDDSGSYLAVNAVEGNSVGFATTGSGARDTVSVNGTVLSGVGATGANVVAQAATLMTASATSQGTISANGSVGGAANVASGATVTLSASDGIPAITAVSQLANGGYWTLGSSVNSAYLGNDSLDFVDGGNTLRADPTGTKVAAFTATNGNATLTSGDNHVVSVNGAAWNIANSSSSPISAEFDTLGTSATMTTAGEGYFSASVNSARTLSAGANGAADTLALANGGEASFNGSVITSVNSLAAGSAWLVRGGPTGERWVSAGSNGYGFAKSTDSVYGALTASPTNGASITGISALSGNVSVSHSDSISGLNVMGTDWTVANDYYTAVFDSDGTSASVSAYGIDNVTVAASTDASVQVSLVSGDAMSGVFNSATVWAHDGDGVVGMQLESNTGISGITSLNSGATVIGDNQFSVNGTYDVVKATASGGAANTQFTLGSSGVMTVSNVVNGDNYSVTGGRVYYDIYSSLSSGGSATVTIGGSQVAITASTDSAVNNAYVVADSNDIVSVAGVKLNDTVTTSEDKNFGIVYNTSDISTDTSYTMNVNSAAISIDGGDLATGTSTIAVDVDDSGSTPHVTISSGIASNATVTVGAGVYNVAGNAAVTVNDSIGYLYVDGNGSVSAEDYTVAMQRIDREASIQGMVSTLNGEKTSVEAYKDFYNIYYGSNSVFSGWTSTVAGYANATVSGSDRTTVASTNGVNILSADGTALGNYPKTVTLQSYLKDPINVEHYEGLYSTNVLNNAVIDARGSNNTLIAIGMNDTEESFSTNHTIFGSNSASTLIVGPNASGDNVVFAGNHANGNYIYHATNSNAKATLVGGSGNDTIFASSADSVVGGAGKDFFFDSSPIEISDYNFVDDTDVIIATKLSATASLTPDNVAISGNRIAIANGNTITVGSSATYDDSTATRAIIANASNSNDTKFAIWSGNYESELDASSFGKGAYMFAQVNEGRADTLIGSTYVDTIWASGNDLIDAGAGNDIINLTTVESGARGATVVLSSGIDSVNGWNFGFDNASGSNILGGVEANAVNFRMRNGEVVAYAENSSLSFNHATTLPSYNILVGDQKVTFIAGNQVASVMSNDDIGNYYKSERRGGLFVSESVTTAYEMTLGSDQFVSINNLNLQNESKSTVWGSAESESISVSGSAGNGARKYVASGGGNDLLTSGGNSSTTAGNFFYFGSYNGTVFSSGRDTIESFGYYRGKNDDPDFSSADVIYLGNSANYTGVNVTSGKAEISLGDDTKVIIHDESGFLSTDNKIARVQFGDVQNVLNVKFGVSSSLNSFTYDGETNIFFGNTSRSRDTLNVSSDLSNVSIWLEDKNYDTNTYDGIGMINAGNVADTKLTLAGSSANNTIISGGSGTTTSLWGGGGETNSLIGGAGSDTFFYFKNIGYTDGDGNYHSSDDKIDKVDSSDLIWLYDVTLADIDGDKTAINSGQITVGLNNGANITVTNMGQETYFRLSDGQGGWQDVKAVSRGNNRYWE